MACKLSSAVDHSFERTGCHTDPRAAGAACRLATWACKPSDRVERLEESVGSNDVGILLCGVKSTQERTGRTNDWVTTQDSITLFSPVLADFPETGCFHGGRHSPWDVVLVHWAVKPLLLDAQAVQHFLQDLPTLVLPVLAAKGGAVGHV